MVTFRTERHPGGDTAKLFRYKAGETNDHGNPVDAWETDFDTLEGCAFDPGSSSEPRRPGEDRVIVEPTLFAAYAVAVDHKDKIEVRGVTYLVEGEARKWKSPFSGVEYGTAIGLRYVSG